MDRSRGEEKAGHFASLIFEKKKRNRKELQTFLKKYFIFWTKKGLRTST
jgi:hypothetical protein